MRAFLGVITVLTALLIATVGASLAGAGTGYTSCPGGYNPDGSSGSFYRQIKAKRVACPAAKKVVKAWVVRQYKSDGANPTKAVTVKGYTCRGRSTGGDDDMDGGLAVTCKHGSRHVITFYGHP